MQETHQYEPARLAPGTRVVIRDEEWLIRSVDPTSDTGMMLTCDGVSELVAGQTRLFLTKLEEGVVVLDPADTVLELDTSSTYNATMLFLESQRFRSVANDRQIHLGHRAVMNQVPYQLDPALQALGQPRSRILIADAVGLGKTLEAGILATELIQRGRGKRILVITQKSMLTQFQKEWWSRFSIPLVRLDSVGLASVRNRIPSNHNPFNYYDKSIISIDTLKNNLEYRNYLSNAWWDIIVIDECHNVAARASEQGMSRRARLARLLATRSDTLILLSATPHDGSSRSFASLMSLLDPTAISDPDDYTPEDYSDKGLVIRRFKKDIRDQVSDDFKERVTTCLRQRASPTEEIAYRALLEVPFTQAGQHQAGRQQELQRVGMQKAMFSSPFAAFESTNNRIAVLGRNAERSTDEANEIEYLQRFAAALQQIDAAAFSKYQKLLLHLRDSATGWSIAKADDRLVIFSERIETLRWLDVQLREDLRLSREQVAVLHGQLSDTEQQGLVERFGRQEDPIRILLCSDVASEGLNLHYFCHRLVHFDLPWSLMVFQQRNGRVDRYGQKHQPQILYLFIETDVERIRGDLRILEILQQKDEQANRNLGDPASFLGVYDPDKEATKVEGFMVEHADAETVSRTLDASQASAGNNEADLLMELFSGGADAATTPSSTDQIAHGRSLFRDDYHFAKTALQQLVSRGARLQWLANDDVRTITITAPADLQDRLRQLPREVQSADGTYALCADAPRVAQAIETARQAKAEDDTWPHLHYLWPQHPIADWMADRVLTSFGRHRAPVICSPHLHADEQAFILLGLIPNRKGQPLLVEWQVVTRRGGSAFQLEGYEAFCSRAQLAADKLPNRNQALPLDGLQKALPAAVATMNTFMVKRQGEFSQQMGDRLVKTLADLERLQRQQMEQLELRIGKLLEALRASRFTQRTRQIHQVFDEYRHWVRDTMTTEPQPYIRVLAAVCR